MVHCAQVFKRNNTVWFLLHTLQVTQESRAIARKPRNAACFSYAQWLFDCHLLQLTKGQGRCSTGNHLSTKSRLNVKLNVYNNTMAHVFWNRVHNDPSRSYKVIDFGTNRKRVVYDFLLDLIGPCRVSEILEILYAKCRFFDTPPLFRPKFRGVPLGVDP